MKKTLGLIVCFVLSAGIFLFQGTYADDVLEDEPFTAVLLNSAEKNHEEPKINAVSAIVMDAKSGRILFEKNAYSRRAMASTTKIMTALVAIENGDLEELVTVSRRAAGIGGSTINLKTGQTMKLKDMLYGLMLNSGNDAAIAIAEHIGGTVENFLEMMNKKAWQIGARNTNFKTPHGLDVDGHFSTAYDLAQITRYALNNPVFSKIVATKTAVIPNRSLYNTNEMLGAYPGADGVKTGYTGKAGRCLVTSAVRNGWRIISVVLNCGSRYHRAQSSKAILDYAFNNYTPCVIQKDGDSIGQVTVIKGICDWVDVRTTEEIVIPLKNHEKNRIEKSVNLPESLSAPVYAGIDAGTVQYILDGEILAESKLKTWSDVERKGFLNYLEDIFQEWCRVLREGMF